MLNCLLAAIFAPAVSCADTMIPANPVDSDPGILTPSVLDTPRINGPVLFGVHPKALSFYAIPATGKRPMNFSAKGLPAGLKCNSQTEFITGNVATAGRYSVVLEAANSLGTANKHFDIVVGEQICLTPPMGWNSWNCWSGQVSQKKVLTSAKAMVEKN
jgi:alpha-galactosidase